MTLGQRIQELRKAAGLTQEGLGEALGVSRQAVSKWESDGGIPELDALIALSRLFGVTIGQLLGVEDPIRAAEPAEAGQEPAAAPGLDEAQVEELLRRYAALNSEKGRFGLKKTAIVAMAAVAVVALCGVWLTGQFKTVSRRVSELNARISNVESQMSSNISWLSGRVEELLDAQSSLISAFDWKPTAVNPEARTVTVTLSLTPKTWSPGTQAQLVLCWTDESTGESGRTESGWLDGPQFQADITLPMGGWVDMTVDLRDSEGVIQTQTVGEIGPFYASYFWLEEPYNILRMFQIEAGSTMTAAPEDGHGGLYIYSPYPELIWPTSVSIQVWINGAQIIQEELEPLRRKDNAWEWGPDAVWQIRLNRGDSLEVNVTVWDNLNSMTISKYSWVAERDGLIEQTPASADVEGVISVSSLIGKAE